MLGNISDLFVKYMGRQTLLPLTTNFSQNVTEPSKGISYPVGDLCRHFTKLTGPCAYALHSNLIPPTDVQMAFCDLSHTFDQEVTNVSQHVFVILLWGILTTPLTRTIHDHALPTSFSGSSTMEPSHHPHLYISNVKYTPYEVTISAN